MRRSSSFAQMLAHSELDDGTKRPPLPLSIGQIGLVGGSGMINGLIECDTPHIIKGRIVKAVRTETEEKVQLQRQPHWIRNHRNHHQQNDIQHLDAQRLQGADVKEELYECYRCESPV